MAKVDDVKAVEGAEQSMRCASLLADRMAQVLCDEEVTEVAIAAALLTSGVVECYTDDLSQARDLLEAIRGIEDRLVAAALDAKVSNLN